MMVKGVCLIGTKMPLVSGFDASDTTEWEIKLISGDRKNQIQLKLEMPKQTTIPRAVPIRNILSSLTDNP
jgi:hypothetical protein